MTAPLIDSSCLPVRCPGGVRFRFRADDRAQHVAVAGTFNSWVGDDRPLRRTAADLFEADVPLSPGRHLYKFVVNGVDWVPDPANPWISEDLQNNSSLTVAPDGDVLLRTGDEGPQRPGPLHVHHQALPSPDWLQDGVLYQLSVRAFGGTFDAVRSRLDHLTSLGISIVWLMPFHPIGQAGRQGALGDPYAVRDFTAIDPSLGDRASLRRLVDALHHRGMRVVMDWTLNRSSCDHPLTRSHPHWYTRDATGRPFYAVPHRDAFCGYDFSQRDLRQHLLHAMSEWVRDVGFDGLRFDDSDITPLDFLEEIRACLAEVRPDIGLISQAYDELHHLASCHVTYDGGLGDVVGRVVRGESDADAVRRYWEASTFTFPRGALRMRWIDDKEQPRAAARLGAEAHRVAAALALTLDGVPHVLMGQEFDEPGWNTWSSLFDAAYQVHTHHSHPHFNADTFEHFQTLIRLRSQWQALRRGEGTFIHGLPPSCVGFWRTVGEQRIRVVVNVSQSPCPAPVPAGAVLHAWGVLDEGRWGAFAGEVAAGA